MGYNRSGHRRTQRLKRDRRHKERLALKAAQQEKRLEAAGPAKS